jgi:GMP synthase (glutamine-hydrolysing)
MDFDFHKKHDLVLVVDFGAQYAQLIARRVRELNIYSEIIPYKATADEIQSKNPSALIFSGGPASVYESGAVSIDPKIYDLKIPILGICYGFQLIAKDLNGVVSKNNVAEYGKTYTSKADSSTLLKDIPDNFSTWMSHRDSVTKVPDRFSVIASTEETKVAAFGSSSLNIYGVQWHPEVIHSEYGQTLLKNFLVECANLKQDWTNNSIIDEAIDEVRQTVGDKKVICALSGGVDSAVAATIVQRAIGDSLTCVFIDHGLLRAGEAEQVTNDFVALTHIKLEVLDAKKNFFSQLNGITDPEQKRKIIGAQFIRAFEEATKQIAADQDIEFLVQGTLYPDVVESGGGSGTDVIKSHHNVGGLPDDLKFKLIEPLRNLFKDEVRQIGLDLGLPRDIIFRHPFPGPGLAIRIIGEVNDHNIDIVRRADLIVRQEFGQANLDAEIWQCPVVLLADVRSVGVQGDSRTYGHPIVLRPVTSQDAMTADWAKIPYDILEKVSTRITNEIPEVNRVILDITSKPPGSIEWE